MIKLNPIFITISLLSFANFCAASASAENKPKQKATCARTLAKVTCCCLGTCCLTTAATAVYLKLNPIQFPTASHLHYAAVQRIMAPSRVTMDEPIWHEWSNEVIHKTMKEHELKNQDLMNALAKKKKQ